MYMSVTDGYYLDKNYQLTPLPGCQHGPWTLVLTHIVLNGPKLEYRFYFGTMCSYWQSLMCLNFISEQSFQVFAWWNIQLYIVLSIGGCLIFCFENYECWTNYSSEQVSNTCSLGLQLRKAHYPVGIHHLASIIDILVHYQDSVLH